MYCQLDYDSQIELLRSVVNSAAQRYCFGQFEGQKWEADLTKPENYKQIEFQAFVELNK